MWWSWKAAAGEILRVLKAGGKTVVSTWRPVAECQVFGAICEALERIDEPEISSMMRVPFDFMPESELADHFESSGFASVRVERHLGCSVLRCLNEMRLSLGAVDSANYSWGGRVGGHRSRATGSALPTDREDR